MKPGSIFCVTLIVISVVLATAQYWFSPLSTSLFIRVLFSFFAIFLITIAIISANNDHLDDEIKN